MLQAILGYASSKSLRSLKMLRNSSYSILLILVFVIISESQIRESTKDKLFDVVCTERQRENIILSIPNNSNIKYRDDSRFTVTLDNQGNEDVGFVRDNTLENFQLVIRDRHGKNVDFSKEWELFYSEPIVSMAVMFIVLKPGEKYVFEVSLPKQIVLKKGNYGIVIKRLLFESDRKTQFCAETKKTKLKVF
jgi:hypothetical protein